MAIELDRPLDVAQLVASVHDEGGTAVLALRGEADASTLGIVVASLARTAAEHDGPVVVDLDELTFVDSRALVAFARAGELLERHGRALWLRSPSPLAARMLGLLGLTHLVEPGPATTD